MATKAEAVSKEPTLSEKLRTALLRTRVLPISLRELVTEAADELETQERSFDLRWKADMRAIKRWQAGDELPFNTRKILEEIAHGSWTVETIKHAQELAKEALRIADHPKELTWPDHADLVVWLLGELEKREAVR
jgi:hypothetical protein